MKLMSGDSCQIYLALDQGKIPAKPIGRANAIGQTGCQTRAVSDRQEIQSASEAGGNGDRIYSAHDFLNLLAQERCVKWANMTYLQVVAGHLQRSWFRPRS